MNLTNSYRYFNIYDFIQYEYNEKISQIVHFFYEESYEVIL